MEDDELSAEIEAQVDSWSSNSNESTTIQLRRSDGTITASFNPDFTYPIFGDEEAIFGYRDLRIAIAFQPHNLRPRVTVKYSDIFPAQGEVKPTDVLEALRDFLPESAFSEEDEDAAKEKEESFVPPGQKIHSYSRAGGEKYEIWCASLADARAKELLENMQILVPMFIEGGTMLQLDQDWTAQRWKLFLLYHVEKDSAATSPYSLVGYGTSYRVFTLPDRRQQRDTSLTDLSTLFTTSPPSLASLFSPSPTEMNDDTAKEGTTPAHPSDLPSRERLSQFVILPPYQRASHGHALYTTMYTHLTTPPNILEFTVEDPNEAFDDLRDLSDLLYLRQIYPSFASLKINTSLPAPSLASGAPIPTDLIVPIAIRSDLQRKSKISPRQFDRLVEMHTLSHIPPLHRAIEGGKRRLTKREHSSNEHDRAYYLWRLYVKQRLYVFNRDQLAQVERPERIEKLEGALESVVEGYARLLERVEKRGGEGREEEVVEGTSTGQRKARQKRKVIGGDDEDEDEDGEDEVMGGTMNGHKKPRVAIA